MKALLDTHTLLWLVDAPEKLPKEVVTICEDENNKLFISIASFWELAIKMSLGKIELSHDGLSKLKNWCNENAVIPLAISLAHCQQVRCLPFHHRDPFDRLLIAQSIEDDLKILSKDALFKEYAVTVIWNE